jgi:DnaJ-class molecular chaperone
MAQRDKEACMPCRGTGRVISNLGGKPQEVTCPWCQGGGVRIAGVDAQATWLDGDSQGGAEAQAAHDAP